MESEFESKMTKEYPEVSVWMLTYNHEKYVKQALESILCQKTDFRFEVVIGDDLSTDGTRKILSEYQMKYPDIIKPIFRDENIGINKNFVDTWLKCKGKYIALLEGDDYWTDENKLQEQYNFLECKPDFVLCYHNTREINELNGSEKLTNTNDTLVTKLEDLLKRGWFIRTGSIFSRNILRSFPDWFLNFQSTDYMMQVLMAEKGKFAFINKETSVYRRHENGITQSFYKNQINFNNKKIELLKILNDYFKNEYEAEISIQIKSFYLSSLVIRSKSIGSMKNLWEWGTYFVKVNHLFFLKRVWTFTSKRILGVIGN